MQPFLRLLSPQIKRLQLLLVWCTQPFSKLLSPQIQRLQIFLASGTNPGDQHHKQVLIINLISFITGLLAFFIGWFLFYLSGNTTILVPALSEAALFAIVIWLNYAGWYFAAGILCHFIQCMATLFFGVILGKIIDAQLMAVFLVGTPLLMFRDAKLRATCILITCLAMLCLELNNHLALVTPIDIAGDRQMIFRGISIVTILFLNAMVLFLYERNNRVLFSRLQATTTKLEEMSNFKSMYVQETTHELRAPLNAIHAVGQLLHDGEYDRQQLSRMHDSILYSSNLALDIINNVLALASIESGKAPDYPVERVHVRQWLQDIAGIFQYQASIRFLQIDTIVDPAVPTEIYLARVPVTQVLGNLLNNAIKFAHPHTSIRVFVTSDGKGPWTVSVEDKGIGIPKEALPQVFTPFYTTCEQNAYGTGLGMHIVQKLVSRMDGTITVASEVGEGTTFSVMLPMHPQGHTSPAGATQVPSADLQGISILVVDDDLASRQFLCKALFRMGSKPAAAATAYEALVLAERDAPDIVLMDMTLPDMNGKDLIKKFRNHPTLCKVPVVFVTGHALAEEQSKAMALGATAFLGKPVQFSQLNATLRRILSHRPALLSLTV